jgi:RNA polymerase primary sigma factor
MFREPYTDRYLTADEERALAGQVAEARRIDLATGRIPDTSARDELVVRNLPLARHEANKFQGRGLDVEDLEQHARLGLIRATETFDPDKGRFTTYAAKWARQRMTEAIENEGALVRVPRWAYQAMRNVAAGRSRSRETMAILGQAQTALRLRLGGHDNDAEIPFDFVSPPVSEPLFEAAEVDRVMNEVNRQPERAAQILRLRFGLGGQDPVELAEVARRVGLSRSRVVEVTHESIHAIRAEILPGPDGPRSPNKWSTLDRRNRRKSLPGMLDGR